MTVKKRPQVDSMASWWKTWFKPPPYIKLLPQTPREDGSPLKQVIQFLLKDGTWANLARKPRHSLGRGLAEMASG